MKNLVQHIQEKLQISRHSNKTIFDSIQPISITDKNTISKTFDYLWRVLSDQHYIYGNGLIYSLDRIYGNDLPKFETDAFGQTNKTFKVIGLLIDSDYSNRINIKLEELNTENKTQWIFTYLPDLAEVLGKGIIERGYGVIDYIINEEPVDEKLQISRNKPIVTNPFIVDIVPDDRNWTLDNISSTFSGHWATDMWHAIDLTKIYKEDSLPKVKNGNNEFTLLGIYVKSARLLGKILLKTGEISTWQFSTITEFFKTLGLGNEELGKGVYVYIRDNDDINEKLQISRNKPITTDYFQVDIFPEAEQYLEKNVIKTLFDANYKYRRNKVGFKQPYNLQSIYKADKLPIIDNNGTILQPMSLYTVAGRLCSDVWCDATNSSGTWNWNIGYDEMLKILGHGDENLGNGVIGYIIYDIKRHG